MSVNNRLAPTKQQNEQVVTYEANGMEVKLTPAMVRNYLVSGNKEAVTLQEVAML